MPPFLPRIVTLVHFLRALFAMELYPGTSLRFHVSPDVQYEQILRVRNLTPRSARVRIGRFPKILYFQVKVKTMSSIAPNLYVDILVKFRFRAGELMPRNLEDEIEVRLQGGPRQVIRLIASRGDGALTDFNVVSVPPKS
jgi:hypothetical protein